MKGVGGSSSVANLAPPFYDKIRANQEALELMPAEMLRSSAQVMTCHDQVMTMSYFRHSSEMKSMY